MKLLTRDTDYALRAIGFIIKQKKELVSVSELVRCLKIPQPFLRKIFQILNKKGILKSVKGRGGGFKLALSPHKIFLLDLLEIFQGPLNINECVFKKRTCPNIKVCSLKRRLDKIQKYVISELKSITLSDLLR